MDLKALLNKIINNSFDTIYILNFKYISFIKLSKDLIKPNS